MLNHTAVLKTTQCDNSFIEYVVFLSYSISLFLFARILIKDGQPKFKVRPEGGRGLFEQHEPQHGGARIPGQEGLQRGLIRNGRQGMQSVGKGPFLVNFEPFLRFLQIS